MSFRSARAWRPHAHIALRNMRDRRTRTMRPMLRAWLRMVFSDYHPQHSPERLRTLGNSYGKMRALRVRRRRDPFGEDVAPFRPSQRAFNRE